MIRPWYFAIELDKENKQIPLYKQIAQKIQAQIMSGGLKPGDALPGSRVLATELGVSRKSVVNAMDLLILSGWLVNKERSGLYVAIPVFHDDKQVIRAEEVEDIKPSSLILRVDDGAPDTRIAPVNELARAYRRLLRMKGRHNVLGYNDPNGIFRFRRAVSIMLNHERGMRTRTEEIFITRGSQMGLYLVAHALLRPDDCLIMEQPCYKKAYEVFLQAGIKVIPIDVDENGIIVNDMLPHLFENVKAVYLTPRHQYPTMVELSTERRRQLVELAMSYHLLMIEDDYDCDFSFRPTPIMPLSAMLPSDLYVYIGTFSKIIAPAIRVGYIATSEANVSALGNLRRIIDIQGDMVMEAAILELIEDGVIHRHINKSTKYYKQKRMYFIELLERHLTDYATFSIPQGGLALWIIPLQPISPDQLLDTLEKHHLSIPVFCDSCGKTGMRIGYASLSEEELEKLVKELGMIFSTLLH